MRDGSRELLGGRFQIEREVGRGGVGIVYRALDTITNTTVALKVIGIFGVDAGEEARFAREGRVLAGLRHPSIVRVIAFGKLEDGEPYIAMEWLEGEDIAQRQKRAPLQLREALTVGAEIADALAASHEAGIVHRDVKPSNIFLTTGGAAKLVDFGVAAADDAKITRTGAIIGTPAYMAPEQARGDREIDARADIYALGATLFEMITGRPPHMGPTPVAILARLVTTPAPRLSEFAPQVPAALDELLARMLAADPEDRPSSAEIVAQGLREIAEDVTPSQQQPFEPRDADTPPPSMGSILLTQSIRPGSIGGSRLVTSILATEVPKGTPRQRILSHLRTRGADATELGGNAIVAHLGVRKALGDEAAQAIDLGLRLAKIGARVGIATGRTRIDKTRPTGEVVDRAAALSRDAQKGQVLVDTTTSELLRGRYQFQLRSDGTAVVGDETSGNPDAVGGAPFVGREADLAQIFAAFERSADDEVPILASVTGASGLGKTRLAREFLARSGSHSTKPRLVVSRGESFAKGHALGVAAEIVRELLGVARSLGSSEIEEEIGRTMPDWVARATPAAIRAVARLAANEPLAEELRGARDALWIALTDFLLCFARTAPLVLAVEDAQWVDTESIAWIEHVLGRAQGKPVFVLLTMRPAFWRDQSSRFAGRDHVRVELRPLSQRSVRAIAKSMLGARASGEAGDRLVDSISVQAAGSPLFAEELARLAAQGRDATSAATIEAAIQVQLDALDEGARETAGRMSVFGLTGWDVGLDELGAPNVGQDLRALASAEIIIEQASSRFAGAREWAFKHALTRDVAYASLSEDALKELHGRAGRWLAKMGEDDAIVARHLDLGGAHVEAATYLERAARRALAASSLPQAVSFAERALAFAQDKPMTFARAQLLDEAYSRLDARAAERDTAIMEMEGSVYDAPTEVRARGARARYDDACGGGPETAANLEGVMRSAHELGVVDEWVRSGAALAARLAFAGELNRAEAVCQELLDVSRTQSIADAPVDAWQTLAVVYQARGEVAAALDARRAAARAARDAQLLTREATLMINVGFALTTLGARADSHDAIVRGIALAQELGSQGVVRHGQMNLLGWSSTYGGLATDDALLSESRKMADDAAVGSWVPHDRATLGVLFYRGVELLRDERGTEAARALLRLAAGAYRATKMLDVFPVALGFWAEAERRSGDAERAIELAREAVGLLDGGSPSLLNEAPLFLALHDACIDIGALGEAKDAVARGMPRLVLRAQALQSTPYTRAFLTELSPNAGLIAAADGYGLVPPELAAMLGRTAEAGAATAETPA